MNHLVATWGYLVVALFVFVEAAGIPLPGETALIVAAAYAGRTHHLSPWALFAVAAACALVGGEVGFVIGRVGGYRLVRRFGHKIHLDDRKLLVGRYLSDEHGPKVVFLGRFVSVLRTYAPIIAGTNRMNAIRFSVANISGALIWAGLVTGLSYGAGGVLRRTSGVVSLVLIGVAVVVVVAVVLLLRHRSEELMTRAEAAYPEEAARIAEAQGEE